MLTKDFLQTVVTASEPGYFCLALSNGTGGWLEEWYKYPDDLDKITARAAAHADHANVYFSTYLFKAPQSTRENVLPTRTIQADLDDADLANIPKIPSILIETSPRRHQAFWILDTELELDDHERLSKKVTYSIPLCDRSGWPLGRKVRVPNTLNHKYLDGPKNVKVVRITGKTYDPDEFEALPEVPNFLVEHFDLEFLNSPTGSDEHPQELLDKIRDLIPINVYVQYGIRQNDRSAALWALMCWGFKAGLTRSEVFTLAKHSANNKFADLRHRADQDLAKDILRAEHAVNSNIQDDRQIIYDILKSPQSPLDRKRRLLDVVLNALKQQGEFVNTYSGLAWYIRRDVGRPIHLTPKSDRLQAMLDVQFGLNQTEVESRFVTHGLISYATSLPETASQSALSYYDPAEHHLLLHTGRKVVLRVTSTDVEQMVDGAYGVIFPWDASSQVFSPAYGRNVIDWGEELFGDGTRGYGSSVQNLLNMIPPQAMAMLKVWMLFILMRNVASTRPILASFGQPGSGKTTLFKKVYTLLYGTNKSLSSITTPDDFDMQMASDPLVALDNVDTWQSWLPDRIALSAGTSDITKRKLYTDLDPITLKRQAVLGVTAHNPKFGREDVADRFLLLSYRRLSKFIGEDDILRDIARKRNLIWGAIISDIQKLLNTPQPTNNIPQFRIEDFARFGVWAARSLGCEQEFVSSIENTKSSQQSFSLEEEGMLVASVIRFVERAREPDKQYTSAQLWSMLESCSDDPRVFGNIYRNSVALSKKLSAMQYSLNTIVNIEQTTTRTGSRMWSLGKKD